MAKCDTVDSISWELISTINGSRGAGRFTYPGPGALQPISAKPFN